MADLAEKLAAFLDALDEWGCDDNLKRAEQILEFQRHGYDLSEYEESPARAKLELN